MVEVSMLLLQSVLLKLTPFKNEVTLTIMEAMQQHQNMIKLLSMIFIHCRTGWPLTLCFSLSLATNLR